MKVVTEDDIQGLYRLPKESHKGQNGRLLVIGGSKLFHASIFWAADIASKIVDLVHFSSPAIENNELVRKRVKEGFWNGIVVPWEKVEDYIREDDCIVIGPGMPRKEGLEKGEKPTGEIVNELFGKFSDKRWVVDGGALQEMDTKLLNGRMVITPHMGELKRIFRHSEKKIPNSKFQIPNNFQNSNDQIQQMGKFLCDFSKRHDNVTVLLKGVKDIVCEGDECVIVEGGNEGMTKGGTGDVLAGLVGALYCKNDAFLAAKAGSLINKSAGDRLYKRVGTYYNASDLVDEVPVVMKELLG
jgi:NAD(P)H-hydrate epimerase